MKATNQAIGQTKENATAPQSVPAMRATDWDVICDFDGTITPFDVTDAILDEFALPGWEDIEENWLRGKIDARECMKSQIGLLRTSQAGLDAFLDSLPIDDGFPGFVQSCAMHGMNPLIVSDGLDYVIKRILNRHGLGKIPVIANRLLLRAGNKYSLEFPYGADHCGSGVCKCRVAISQGRKTLLIGDGRSDCCLAGKAAFVLAKKNKELLRFCESKGYPHQAYTDFFDVRALLEKQNRSSGGEQHKALAV